MGFESDARRVMGAGGADVRLDLLVENWIKMDERSNGRRERFEMDECARGPPRGTRLTPSLVSR